MTTVISSSLVIADVLSGGGVINTNNPLIGYHNLITEGNISAITEAEGYPADNLANPSTAQKWVGTVDDFDEYITAVLNTVDFVDYVGIAKHNFFSEQIAVSLEVLNEVDSFTKILLNFNGTDGSTTFTDESSNGHTFSAAGNAQLDTAQRKWGSASLLLDGTGDYVSETDHASFTLSSSDFAIEVVFHVNAAGGTELRLAGHTDAGATAAGSAFRIQRNASNQMVFELSDGSSFTSLTGTTQFTNALNTGWHYLKASRSGNTISLQINDTVEDTDTFTGTVPDCSGDFAVGARGGGVATNPWNGWVDSFRLSVGTDRSDVSVPVEFPWVQVIDPFIPPSDDALMMRFEPQAVTSLRVRLQPGNDVPQASVMYAGTLLVLQRRVYVGHSPVSMATLTQVTTGRSESGNFLGRVVRNRAKKTSVSLDNLTPDWVRTYLKPFLIEAQVNPFFFSWRPGDYPNEVGFCWMMNDPIPQNARVNGMMKVGMDFGGIAT